ncbi:MAG TPA: hypothetical protein VE666_08195 [Mycobacterium sp.]|nr:hypothetical protein [Mycobacterium sp.]
MAADQLDSSRILAVGTAYWPAKTGADFAGWCRDVGFRDTEVLPLTETMSAAVAYK